MTVSNSTGGNTVIEPAATGKRLGQRGKKPEYVHSSCACLTGHHTAPLHPALEGDQPTQSCFPPPFATGFFNILAAVFSLLFLNCVSNLPEAVTTFQPLLQTLKVTFGGRRGGKRAELGFSRAEAKVPSE